MTMAIGIPAMFRDATWAGLPDGKIKDTTKRYLENFTEARAAGIAPMYLGKARTWKTSAACVIALAVADRGGLDTQFVSVPEWMADFTLDRFGRANEDLYRWRTVSFLVLDDFAQIPPDGDAAAVLVGVVAARFNAKLPTIWTGNLAVASGQELKALHRYGPLFSRRVLERSEGYRVSTL